MVSGPLQKLGYDSNTPPLCPQKGQARWTQREGEKEKEYRVLTQLKKTQAYVFVWGLLMASHKHCSAILDALNGKEVPIKTTS